MREYTLRFWRPDGDIHSFSEQFASEPEIEPKYIHRMEILGDGTATMLNECTGPPERVEAVLRDDEKVIDAMATGTETTFFYVHFEPDPVISQMMKGRRETSLTLRMPLELRPDGSVIGRYIGTESAVEETLGTVPDGVETELIRAQNAVNEPKNVTSSLTARQREVLGVAIEKGYYDDPRETTHEAIATELGITTATVGEHLRKVEAKIVGSLNV